MLPPPFVCAAIAAAALLVAWPLVRWYAPNADVPLTFRIVLATGVLLDVVLSILLGSLVVLINCALYGLLLNRWRHTSENP